MPTIEHNTSFIGKVLKSYKSLESTNSKAFDLLAKSSPIEGTVISAGFQTAGRGQFGSSWFSSPDKNIILSLVLYPDFLRPGDYFLLNQAVSLAVYDLINSYFPGRASIKWPNDIYCDESKMAGILIQNVISGNKISASVIGIGINVNESHFPPELPNPVSIFQITGRHSDLSVVSSHLFGFLESRYLSLRSGKGIEIRKAYHGALFRLNKPSLFSSQDEKFTGMIRGVEDQGKLILETEGNKIRTFDFKEIRFITD